MNMVYLWLILLIILNSAMLMLTLFALPGNWLMISLVVIFSFWQKGIFSIYVIIFAIILATVGEIIEFVSGAGGAKAAGGSKRAMAGAILGAITGAILGTIIIPIPIIGTLAGTAIGAGLTVLMIEHTSGKELKKSLKTATGAGAGQLLGIGAKFIIGAVIWLIFAIAAFV